MVTLHGLAISITGLAVALVVLIPTTSTHKLAAAEAVLPDQERLEVAHRAKVTTAGLVQVFTTTLSAAVEVLVLLVRPHLVPLNPVLVVLV
jgi:hypothetical protein